VAEDKWIKRIVNKFSFIPAHTQKKDEDKVNENRERERDTRKKRKVMSREIRKALKQ
jgi:hypothetical protein